jgi:hypothetical protein
MQQQLEDRKKRKNPGSGSWNGGQSQKSIVSRLVLMLIKKDTFPVPKDMNLVYVI